MDRRFVVHGLFPGWMCEITQRDLGNVPSGVPGYRRATMLSNAGLRSAGETEDVLKRNVCKLIGQTWQRCRILALNARQPGILRETEVCWWSKEVPCRSELFLVSHHMLNAAPVYRRVWVVEEYQCGCRIISWHRVKKKEKEKKYQPQGVYCSALTVQLSNPGPGSKPGRDS